jgi:hypothetical protein
MHAVVHPQLKQTARNQSLSSACPKLKTTELRRTNLTSYAAVTLLSDRTYFQETVQNAIPTFTLLCCAPGFSPLATISSTMPRRPIAPSERAGDCQCPASASIARLRFGAPATRAAPGVHPFWDLRVALNTICLVMRSRPKELFRRISSSPVIRCAHWTQAA